MKQAKIDEAIIDVTEPNFKFRYFSRYGPHVGAISKKLPMTISHTWSMSKALWPFGLFLSESFKIEPKWLQTLLPSTCKLHFRAYLAGVIEKSDEGIQECEQCLDRLGGFSTFRWLRAPAFENNFWEPFKVKLRFGGENIYLVDNELSLADLVLVKDLILTLFIAWQILKGFKNISYVTIRSK